MTKSIRAAICAAAMLPALTQANEDQIESMVVTATASPRLISEVLSVSTVISRADIDLYQASDLFDLLSREAGVSFVRNGGRGSSTSLLLRGNQADHTLFLIDGVRTGSATSGSASLSAINTDLVERIEIIRGPKSALYGADAIGGVVNLITRTALPDSKVEPLSLDLSYGSNSTREFSAVGALKGDRYQLSAVWGFQDTDGIDNTENTRGVNGDDDGYENQSIALNYAQNLADGLDLRLVYSRNEGTNEYDSNCKDATTKASVDCLIFAETLVDTFIAKLDYQLSDTYRTSLHIAQSRDESEQLAENIDLTTTSTGGIFNTTRSEATWTNFFELSEDSLMTAGIDYLKDEVDGSTQYDVDSRNNKAAFVQYETRFDPLSLTLGLRYDDNEQFGSETTASVQAGYQLNDDWRVIASYAEGFKPPTFNDLYYPNFGNPNFVPETSENFELALQGSLDKADLYIAAYRNDVENLIQYNPATSLTDQVSKAEITGLEFDADVQLADWSLGVSGNLIKPENKATGNTLRRRAERTLSVDLDSQSGALSYGASVRAESHRFENASNTKRLGGFALVDLRTEYQLNEEWAFQARINNLFDKDYVTASSFSLGNYRNLGREAFISVSYTPSL